MCSKLMCLFLALKQFSRDSGESILLRGIWMSRRALRVLRDPNRPYYGQFRGKLHGEGSCSKAAGVLSKVLSLDLV